MTNVADEIRAATAKSELHPLVAKSYASPRGHCNAHFLSHGAVWCTLDYGHAECAHVNGDIAWSMTWPPRPE